MKKPIVIAEIGCNHKGDMELAKKFIKTAKEYCGADVVKFQKRDIETWTERYPEQYNAPHPIQLMLMEILIKLIEKLWNLRLNSIKS